MMKILLSSVLLCLCLMVYAQHEEPKFGKIDMAEMTMTRYEKDTTAAALMFFDYGYCRFALNRERKFQYVFERHFRIKILKKSGYNLADFNIKLYKNENNTRNESLSGLEACTFNLVDGKIVKTKLCNDKIYSESGRDFSNRKFAFPDVREGSIIELSYIITSDFLYDFRGWNFQHNYPVVWSQYICVIPDYFEYRESFKGYLPFTINEKKQGTERFLIHYDAENEGGMATGGYQKAQNYDITAINYTSIYSMNDIPAFIAEPNIDCEENYKQALEFELKSVQYPEQLRVEYAKTWESVNTEMKESEQFGRLLKSSGFIRDTVEMLCQNKTTNMDKAVAIYSYVQNRMSWNGFYSLWPSIDGLKRPFLNRTGTSSEINLLLTLMLQAADMKANPVIFSTRDNGVATTYFPTISKFNSVLTKVDIDGKSFLLDATSKYCPFGVIPANDINGNGRVVNDETGDWVDLNATEKHRVVKSYDLSVSTGGDFSGCVIESYVGYAAIEFRNALSHSKSNDDFIRELQEGLDGLSINSYSISDKYNIYKPIVDTLNIEVAGKSEIVDDRILFRPLLFEVVDKNHFTLENRQYPIDYNFPYSETYMFSYTIPAGYYVESMPQSIAMKLPDGSMSVSYTLQNIDNKIKISYKRFIGKVQFLPDEYNDLKDFYDQIVKKHAEQIILKKTI